MNSDFYKMQRVYAEGYNGSANQSNYPTTNFNVGPNGPKIGPSYGGGGLNGPGNGSPVNNTPGGSTGANTPNSGDLISFPSDRTQSYNEFRKQIRKKLKFLIDKLSSSDTEEATDIQSALEDIIVSTDL